MTSISTGSVPGAPSIVNDSKKAIDLASGTYSTTRPALSVAAAREAPSSTKWGVCVSRNSSLWLAGSPSDRWPPPLFGDLRVRRPATWSRRENQAPPWPRRPLASSSSKSVVRALLSGRGPQWARCASRSTIASGEERALRSVGTPEPVAAWRSMLIEELSLTVPRGSGHDPGDAPGGLVNAELHVEVDASLRPTDCALNG